MTTYRVSHISARSLFVAPENIAMIKDALRMRRSHNITSAMLADWYDRYMMAHRIEPSKIDDVRIWCDHVTDQFIRHWAGLHNVSAEQVPYLPFDTVTDRFGGPEMHVNKPMISSRQPSGRFPRFNLPSAVEDGVDENGEIIVHNEHATIRMFQPVTGTQGRGWRFGKNDPRTMKWVAPRAGELLDRGDNGTLYDWELLNRRHTPYPMEQYFSVG
jgi:hypothetical protein